MLPMPAYPEPAVRPLRHWKAASSREAAGMVPSGTTIAVNWIGDNFATALAAAFRERREPRDLTIVYAATPGLDRVRGLNRLAIDGMVRRVIGGQWHPVPALHGMAIAGRIEAYSLPVGLINRLFRDMADGLPSHITRAGLGTLADPRWGGGRLNRRTREEIVHLVRPAGKEALMFPAFPVDVGVVGVGFLADTGVMVMTREGQTIARAVHRNGGIVIAQPDRVGTQPAPRPNQTQVPDSMVDILIMPDPRDEVLERELLSPPWRAAQQYQPGGHRSG